MKLNANMSKDFALDITTKDGDRLKFSMFDKKSLEAKKGEDSTTLKLKSQIGFSFNYTGNGLSKDDIKEIKEAVKKVAPNLDKFMQDSRIKELNPEHVIKSALKISDMLPQKADENEKKALMGELLKDIGKRLHTEGEKIKQPNKDEIKSKMLEDSKKLLEELWKNMSKAKEKQDEANSKMKLGFYA